MKRYAAPGLSSSEAARLLHYAAGSLSRFARLGRLGRRVVYGKRVVYRFTLEEIERFKEQHDSRTDPRQDRRT